MLILAHAGHWAASLIYFSPVVLVTGGIALTAWKDRRAERREEEEKGQTGDPPA